MAIDAAVTVGDLLGGGVFLHPSYDEMSADSGFDDFHHRSHKLTSLPRATTYPQWST